MKNSLARASKALKEEISLTLMVISFLLIVGVGILQVLKKVESTGPFMELFLTCCGLYFGRKWVKSAKTEEKTAKTAETEEL